MHFLFASSVRLQGSCRPLEASRGADILGHLWGAVSRGQYQTTSSSRLGHIHVADYSVMCNALASLAGCVDKHEICFQEIDYQNVTRLNKAAMIWPKLFSVASQSGIHPQSPKRLPHCTCGVVEKFGVSNVPREGARPYR